MCDSWQQAFRLPDVILNRQIELGDLLLGFEQQRQMSLQTPSGELLLAIAEEPGGLFSGVILRQLFESTRAFTINVFALDNPSQPQGTVPEPTNPACIDRASKLTAVRTDLYNAVLFQIKRSFPWFDPMAWLFREILVTDAQNKIVASVTRVWHPLYRRYAIPANCGVVVMHQLVASFPFHAALHLSCKPLRALLQLRPVPGWKCCLRW